MLRLLQHFLLFQVSQKSLRQLIGVVPQDTVLFNESIKYNIAYGRVGSSDTEVKEAAASSDIHVKINTFPESKPTRNNLQPIIWIWKWN